MTSWEYKVMKTEVSIWSGKEKTDPEQFLSNLGRDGWELVSVVPTSGSGGTTSSLQFFFKRKRF